MMMRMGLAVLLCLLANGLAAAPRAWLDRDTITMGETVTLNVEADSLGEEPDFSPLDRDFRRLGTSSSTQISLDNGRQQTRVLWAVALEPKTEGVIGIPALDVGNQQTDPVRLTVRPQAAGVGDVGDDVYLEVDVEPRNPYVQQQVRYTVRLFYAVTLLEGQLEEGRPDGAELRRLGQDRSDQRMVEGRRYNVVERQYALIPQSSGELSISAPVFRGRALSSSSRRMYDPGNVLTRHGEALTLDVRQRPEDAKTPWLPARSLQLLDGAALADEVRVGEPLTLALRMVAEGLVAEQLPELELPDIEGADVYPDQESSQTRDDGRSVFGERIRRFAVVPREPGTLRLPEVSVQWWDVETDRPATATWPAREIRVLPASGGIGASSEAAPGLDQPMPVSTTPAPLGATSSGIWPWLASLFAALWLLTLGWAYTRRGLPAAAASEARPAAAAGAPGLSRALAEGDLSRCAQALLAAARRRAPGVAGLGEVATLLEPPVQRDAVHSLQRALYGTGADAAAVRSELRAAFAKGPAWVTAVNVAESGVLPPLYPGH